MRGELDFEQSLRKRVALLAGLDERVLEEVYENVLQLSPGAEFLLEECKRNDVKFMLVSGGFTFFTERLQRRLGLDFHFANVLEVENGKLTGRLKGRIIDAQAKADLLREYRKRLALVPWQVVAMGDGANDIPMIREAGFGIAYRRNRKPRRMRMRVCALVVGADTRLVCVNCLNVCQSGRLNNRETGFQTAYVL